MPILSPPPLPVERFEAFKRFVLTIDPEGWANATGIALSIHHMLGIAIVGPDAADEALQQWAAIYGTQRWRRASKRAQRAAERPLPYAFSLALDTPLQGLDEAAWAVSPDKILELNSWLRWALSEFYAAHGQALDPVPPTGVALAHQQPVPPTAVAPAHQQPLPSGRGNTPYNDDAEIARAREIYQSMTKPTKTKAAQAAIAEWRRNNPQAELPAISEKAWIERVSRKI